MSVYIESVVLDNFFITLLISKASYRALSLGWSRRRAVPASLLATAVAVGYPFLKIHAGFLLLIKFGLGAALVLILFYKKCKIPAAAGVFLGLTFTFGGALFALGLVVYGDIDKALRLPVTNVPAGLIIAGGFILSFFVKKITAKLKRVRDAKNYVSRAEILIFGKTISGTAFLDTGNRLYDDKTSLPVIVLGAKSSLQILGDTGLSAMLRGKEQEISPSARFIGYGGADGRKSRLLVLKPDAVRFYVGQDPHTIKDVMIGLAFSKFSDAVDYDIILHPAILKGDLI